MAVRIQHRRGTTSEWNSADPTLFEGEIGYNTTLDKFKIGDGTSAWSVLEYVPTSADLSTSLGDYIALTEKGGADGVAELDASFNVLTKTAVVFEGTTADAYETTLFVTEPTADRTITLPNATGTVALTSDITTAVNSILDGAPAALDTLNELAAAINDDASYASTITTALGGKIDKSTIDAAGDLLIGTADNTVGRLAIGLNGYLLTSNGTTATWAAAPISLPSQTGNSGKYLTTDGTTASWGTVSSYSAPTLGTTSVASGSTVSNIDGLTINSTTIPTSKTLVVTTDKLSVHAATTSAELLGVISDETGSGSLVFGTGPTISLPVINNLKIGYSTTATAAGTTTLTVSSNHNQFFTGTTTQTIVLPVASTMTLGMGFHIENLSTGNLTVNSSGGNLVATVIPGSTVLVTSILTSGTTAASWDADFTGFSTITGTGANVLGTAPTISNLVLSGTLNAGGANGTSGQVLQSTGTGVSWTTPAGGAAFSEFMLIGA